MNNSVCFISHPYHRGGVTQWMASAFNSWNTNLGLAYFVTVTPERPFISALDRPLIVSMLDVQYIKNVFDTQVNFSFELGNVYFRAKIYRDIILANIPEGIPIIPSDDEACWLAASTLAMRNPFVPVVHSFGDESYYLLLQRFNQSAMGIVTVSERVAKRVIEALPKFPNDRLLVNPCGVPVSKIEHHKRKNNVLWMGRMDEQSKRVSDLPKIIEGIAKLGIPVNFIIVGDGEMFPMLKQFSVSYTSETVTVSLRGWLEKEKINELLFMSKVLVLTSNYEGMPVSAIEALAHGCSVVSTRVSGIEDIEESPRTSKILYRYDVGDTFRAIALIEKAISEHNELVEKAANEFAIEYFSIESRNESLEFFLEELLKGGRVVKDVKLGCWRERSSVCVALLRLLKWKLLTVGFFNFVSLCPAAWNKIVQVL